METVTDDAIVKKLVESEAGRKAAAAIQRDWTSERMNMRAQIEVLKRERGELSRTHADDVEATRKRMEAARAALTKTDTEHRQAVITQKQTRAHFDARIKALEGKLRATAPQAISDFIEWLGDEESLCKETGIIEHATPTDKINTFTSELIKQYFSNAKSLDARLKAIRAARAEAGTLKARILEGDDLQQRLDSLRDSLPVVAMQYSHTK